jgi:hypothetical protein
MAGAVVLPMFVFPGVPRGVSQQTLSRPESPTSSPATQTHPWVLCRDQLDRPPCRSTTGFRCETAAPRCGRFVLTRRHDRRECSLAGPIRSLAKGRNEAF